MDKRQMAEQFRRAVQLFAEGLGEDVAMEISTIYDEWRPNTLYKAGKYIVYGTNSVGDPQLYKVIQEHTSQDGWKPSEEESLYEPIGLTAEGFPIWSQPSGAHDAYNKGDIVEYNGQLYISLIDGNIWSPDAYPAGWEIYKR